MLGFWPLKFQKTYFLMDPKIQNFQNFQKTVTYICYSATSRLPAYEISSQ